MPGPSQARNNYLMATRGTKDPRSQVTRPIVTRPQNVYAQAVAPVRAAAPVAPARSLFEDPAYLAFQRTLGASETSLGLQRQASIDSLNQMNALRLTNLAERGEESRSKMGSNALSRGIYRSGVFLNALGKNKAEELRQGAETNLDTSNQVAGIQNQYAQNIAQLYQRNAEQGLTTAYNNRLLGAA